MKKLKYLLNVFLASALIFACVEEIENNMLIKRNIVNKIIINVIKRKYLINDINLYQYIEEL